MVPYDIILADDHAMFRRGIKRILEEHEDLRVVEEVGDGLEVLKQLRRAHADMVVLDISMPNLRGIEVTQQIRKAHPEVKVLILTMHKDKEHLYQAIMAGADGYLLKEDADIELLNAIRAIRDGGIYISQLLSNLMAELVIQRYEGSPDSPPSKSLTAREREILSLCADGKSSREIADLLCISSRTVEHHRSSIMRKLNIKKNADLVKYAIRKGFTSAT